MNLITIDHICRAAPLRYAMQYRDKMEHTLHNGSTPSDVFAKLTACDLKPETINEIIGNDSWTKLQCSCCRKSVQEVVNVDVTGGEYATYLCENCVSNMAVKFLP